MDSSFLENQHQKEVSDLQTQFKILLERRTSSEKTPIALHYKNESSNTTRTKGYKKGCLSLACGHLNKILKIDLKERAVTTQPRVTMETLVKALIPYGMMVPVIPEFKGITVGGALLGAAAESSSFRWGIFHDCALRYQFLQGDGTILTVSATHHPDIFHGLASSYGSLGLLLSSTLKLIPIQQHVLLRTLLFDSIRDALEYKSERLEAKEAPDFLDGIVFSKKKTAIIEGYFKTASAASRTFLSPWYFRQVEQHFTAHEEVMNVFDYLFRFDQGAFWMGSYLFSPFFIGKFLIEGIMNLRSPLSNYFNSKEIQKLTPLPKSPPLAYACLSPLFKSQTLWRLLHHAEEWIQKRFIIQDFCIPQSQALTFLEDVVEDPALFPLWLCPIKTTSSPQLFSPHLSQHETHLINIGMYGLPSYSASIHSITNGLEKKTVSLGGRKVLYSYSTYTQEDFWTIYPASKYAELRAKTAAEGVWHDITDKVLSL